MAKSIYPVFNYSLIWNKANTREKIVTRRSKLFDICLATFTFLAELNICDVHNMVRWRVRSDHMLHISSFHSWQLNGPWYFSYIFISSGLALALLLLHLILNDNVVVYTNATVDFEWELILIDTIWSISRRDY